MPNLKRTFKPDQSSNGSLRRRIRAVLGEREQQVEKRGQSRRRLLKPTGLAESVGPFSRAVLIDDVLYIAGTTALSHVSGGYHERVVPSTIEEQTRLTLENIKKTVEYAGGSMADIFKVVVMLKNPSEYQRMNAVRAEYFRDSLPISTCYKADLMRDDILVEIEAMAFLQPDLGQ